MYICIYTSPTLEVEEVDEEMEEKVVVEVGEQRCRQ